MGFLHKNNLVYAAVFAFGFLHQTRSIEQHGTSGILIIFSLFQDSKIYMVVTILIKSIPQLEYILLRGKRLKR